MAETLNLAVVVGKGDSQHIVLREDKIKPVSKMTACGQVWTRLLGMWPQDSHPRCRKCVKFL